MRRLLCAPLVLSALALPAAAQDGPSFDCAAAESSAEKLVCGNPELSALDRRLADRYAAALKLAQPGDDTDTLKAMQRGWVKGRDECWTAEDEKTCVTDSYLTREGALVAGFMLEDPFATALWTCENNPANEIVTMFFDTELPSLRIERGDRVQTATLARSGSGARYTADFGSEFWEKGNEASYRGPDPDGEEMTCTKAE